MEYTKEQIDAISHNKGNLKIIACAGSGKTTVMSERIAKLVSEGVDRDKIIAFTFTEKAAASLKFNIRDKLSNRCPDAGHLGSMYIGTIHSYAFQALKELVPKFRGYDVLDEVKRVIWVSKNYSNLGMHSIRKERNPVSAILRFLRTIDIIRDNDISDEKLDELPEFKEVYEKYIKLLDEEKYIDFSGQIYNLVNVLESNPELLKELRENVEYLIVDEYQDINHIQEKLINLIVGAKGNLCVVGDDDQSIFEFQGADTSNIINFEKRYNDVKIVELVKNFRCPKEVIESAAGLIRRNRNRISKSMVPGAIKDIVKKSEKGDFYKVEFASIDEEVNFIINKIKALRGYEWNEDNTTRGIDYGDMAIIVRTKRSAQRLINPLQSENIPFNFKGTGGLFLRDEINFLRHTLCFLADKSPDFTSGTPTLNDLEEIFQSLNWGHLNWDKLTDKLLQKREVIQSIDSSNLDSKKRRIFLQEFFYEIMDLFEVNEDNFTQDLLFDFGRFSEVVAQFEAVHGWINFYYFGEFVNFLNGYALHRTDEGGIDDQRNRNSVNILTVHQAKGLEFPIVFIPDLSNIRFPSSRRNRPPETHLNPNVFNLARYCSGDEGERRLFYVAATRTQKFLFITRSNQSDTGKVSTRSQYVTEFDHEIMILDSSDDPTIRNKITPRCRPNMELMPTSFSDLKYYIDCPYRYLLQQMMGFSPVLNTAYGYGLQVHNFLNLMHKKWSDTPPTLDDVESMVESDFFLRYTRGPPFDNMKNKAKKILKGYVLEYGKEFPLRLETEKPFEHIMSGALISGSIDLLQKFDPKTNEWKDVSILDYKTEKETLESKKYIRLQLRLYSLATNKSLGMNAKSAKIHYLTENIRDEIDISDEKLQETQEQITTVIDNIKQGEFSACPGNNCKSCDMKVVCKSSKT